MSHMSAKVKVMAADECRRLKSKARAAYNSHKRPDRSYTCFSGNNVAPITEESWERFMVNVNKMKDMSAW